MTRVPPMGTPPWTKAQDAVADRMVADGHTLAAIGDAIGRTPGAVKARLVKRKAPVPHATRPTVANPTELMGQRLAGKRFEDYKMKRTWMLSR